MKSASASVVSWFMKTNVPTSFTIVGLLLIILGCATQPKSNSSVSEWQGVDPGLARDLAKVKNLCPVGTSAGAARDLLGARCHLAHYYGPSLHTDSQNGREAGEQDEWALEYKTSHGKICLWLKWPSGSDQLTLDHAVISSIEPKKQIFTVHNPPPLARTNVTGSA